MKKLRIVRIAVIGLLLAGAVALVGCSRYNTAHESQGKGRGTELAGRSLEQGSGSHAGIHAGAHARKRFAGVCSHGGYATAGKRKRSSHAGNYPGVRYQ